MNIMQEIQNNIFFIFIFIFYIYYNLFINRDPKQIFFIFALTIILYIFYYKNYKVREKKTSNVSEYFLSIEDYLSSSNDISTDLYHINKYPKKLTYLKMNDDFKNILYELKFITLYDKELYMKLITFIESFLRIHYKILISKYEFGLYYQVLKDIRREILNIINSVYFNIPNISKILDINNLDDYIYKRAKLLQSRTYKYLKTLYQKNKSHTFDSYNAPFENDITKNHNYDIF